MIIDFSCLGKQQQITTKTIYHFKCDRCNCVGKRLAKTHSLLQKKYKIDNDLCSSCLRNVIMSSDLYRSKMKETLSLIVNDPIWRQKNSDSKKGRINLGNKNGMKRLDVRNKVSNTRKKRMHIYRNAIKEATKQAWKDGKFSNVKVGRCKWYTLIDSNGIEHKVQGKYELAYANWLIKEKISFESHKDRIEYAMNGEQKSYYPDFKLIDGSYIEIKSSYF